MFSGQEQQYYRNKQPIGPNATVIFISDSSVSEVGFQIEFLSVSATPFTDCGGYIVGSGNFTSPNYPGFYPPNCHCTWTVASNEDEYILLRIITLHTEEWFDYVYIYNGSRNSSEKNLISKYSGTSNSKYPSLNFEKPVLVRRTATVVFTSDNLISASGFQIEYTSTNITAFTECGGVINGSGKITSPNYPGFYPPNCHCVWTLIALSGQFLSVATVNMQTEYSNDYVYIFNGTAKVDSSPSNYLRMLSGQEEQDYRKQLIGPNATVLFISDSSISEVGFEIEYLSLNVTPFTDCGGHLVGSGNITSPHYPSSYPNNSRCTWTIAASPGHYLFMKTWEFDTEEAYDAVLLYNGTTVEADNVKSIMSGYGSKGSSRCWWNKLCIIGKTARVLFESDSTVSASGFQIEYVSLNITPFTDCGGYLIGSGNIMSPNYPNDYPANSRCAWTLSASPGKYVFLQVMNVSTEYMHDSIYIYNGSEVVDSNQNYFYRISGSSYYQQTNMRKETVIRATNVTIIFISDGSVSASGFHIKFTSVTLPLFTGTEWNRYRYFTYYALTPVIFLLLYILRRMKIIVR